MVSAWVTPAAWKVAQLSGPVPVISLYFSTHPHFDPHRPGPLRRANRSSTSVRWKISGAHVVRGGAGREDGGKQCLSSVCLHHPCWPLGPERGKPCWWGMWWKIWSGAFTIIMDDLSLNIYDLFESQYINPTPPLAKPANSRPTYGERNTHSTDKHFHPPVIKCPRGMGNEEWRITCSRH